MQERLGYGRPGLVTTGVEEVYPVGYGIAAPTFSTVRQAPIQTNRAAHRIYDEPAVITGWETAGIGEIYEVPHLYAGPSEAARLQTDTLNPWLELPVSESKQATATQQTVRTTTTAAPTNIEYVPVPVYIDIDRDGRADKPVYIDVDGDGDIDGILATRVPRSGL